MLVVLGWTALLTAFMPPGVCPCWLMFDPAHHHPHFDGHPEQPHSHEYLLDLFESQTAPAAPMVFVTEYHNNIPVTATKGTRIQFPTDPDKLHGIPIAASPGRIEYCKTCGTTIPMF